MESTTRRALLKWGVAAALSSRVPYALATERTDRKKLPRYFMSVLLGGGIDAILSADPKSRAEVEPWVDIPYRSSDIVSAGNLRLGPLFQPLVPTASRLTFVNGVQVGTANHITGRALFARMATGGEPTSDVINPTRVLELIGNHRDTQAVGFIDTTKWLSMGRLPSGMDMFTRLEAFSPEECRMMMLSLRKQAERLRPSTPATARSFEETASYLERLPSVPTFREEIWSENSDAQRGARALQRALWAFKHDLARAFYIEIPSHNAFDSHNFNLPRQTKSAESTIPMLARFFQTLESTSNQHGKLADTTVAVFGSELGRFPRINGSEGKDHFPEVPLVFYGANSQHGVFGATDRTMMGVPISLKTGAPQAGGHTLVLDDVGTTLLHLGGVANPKIYGYTGTVLPFLV